MQFSSTIINLNLLIFCFFSLTIFNTNILHMWIQFVISNESAPYTFFIVCSTNAIFKNLWNWHTGQSTKLHSFFLFVFRYSAGITFFSSFAHCEINPSGTAWNTFDVKNMSVTHAISPTQTLFPRPYSELYRVGVYLIRISRLSKKKRRTPGLSGSVRVCNETVLFNACTDS